MNINNNLALSYMYKVLSGVYKILKQTNTSRLIYKNLRVNTEECGDVIMRGDVIQLYDVMRCMRTCAVMSIGCLAAWLVLNANLAQAHFQGSLKQVNTILKIINIQRTLETILGIFYPNLKGFFNV